ncbi:EF-hand domain-containing protein [Leptospira interrogans]
MKKRTMVIMAGVLVLAGGAAAIAAVGEKRGRFGHGPHGMGPHGMGMSSGMMGEIGFGGRGGMGRWLQSLDADSDGAVTIDEMLAKRAPFFNRLDTNGDGVIDAKEIEAEIGQNVAYFTTVMFKRLDKDGDGKITKQEYSARGAAKLEKAGDDDDKGSDQRAERRRGEHHAKRGERGERRGWHHERRAERMFERLDLNSDGALDAGEVEVGVKQRVTRQISRALRRFDQDGDGQITRAEFEKPARDRFASRDVNDDGKITEEDLPPFMRGRGILR